MNEKLSLNELKQEASIKKKAYFSLLEQNPRINKAYSNSANAALALILGAIFAVISLFIGLFQLGAAIALALCIIYYKVNKQFEELFEEMASDELKKARKDYKECADRLKEAEKKQQN